MYSKLMGVAMAAIVGGVMTFSSVDQAEAGRDRCVYMARDGSTGKLYADGWAKAYKKSTACKRAARRCNRELKRKKRQKKVPRGIKCIHITNL